MSSQSGTGCSCGSRPTATAHVRSKPPGCGSRPLLSTGTAFTGRHKQRVMAGLTCPMPVAEGDLCGFTFMPLDHAAARYCAGDVAGERGSVLTLRSPVGRVGLEAASDW